MLASPQIGTRNLGLEKRDCTRWVPFMATLMAVPLCGRALGAFSKTCARMPRSCNPSANAIPPRPPPTMAMSTSITMSSALRRSLSILSSLSFQPSLPARIIPNLLVKYNFWSSRLHQNSKLRNLHKYSKFSPPKWTKCLEVSMLLYMHYIGLICGQCCNSSTHFTRWNVGLSMG